MEYIGGKERYDRLLKGLALGMTRRRACDYAGLSVDALALVMSAEYPSAEVSALIDTIRRAEVHSLVSALEAVNGIVSDPLAAPKERLSAAKLLLDGRWADEAPAKVVGVEHRVVAEQGPVIDATALATLTPSALRERLLALEQGEEPGPDLD